MSNSATIKAGNAEGSGHTLPAIGSVIAGRYRIERVVGAGGMGFVYAARHLQLGELVAVKVLHPKVAIDTESVERFLREARACVKIKNEHVVKVLDVFTGDHGSPPYILMEFLEGTELGKLISEHGPMPAQMAVDYLLQACEAIAEAHAYGIVHRDIKPANLLLTQTSDGAPFVKVLDFGISKALAPEDDTKNNLTETTAVFGSPSYMSPEQVRSAKHVDARADVWSLGVVLFELLTGRLPFRGESMSGLLASIVADQPIPLAELRPDAPVGLDGVIARCLEKRREQRAQSVAELALLLAPFASPSGLNSVEVIQRLAGTVPTGSSLRASMRPSFHPASMPPGASSSPVMAFGATERSVVTISPAHTKSNATLIAALIGVIGALLIGGGVSVYMLTSARRANARGDAASASNGPSAVTTAPTSSAVSPTALEAASSVSAARPGSTLIAPQASATTTAGRPPRSRNGGVAGGQPAGASATPSVPVPATATSAAPSATAPKANPLDGRF